MFSQPNGKIASLESDYGTWRIALIYIGSGVFGFVMGGLLGGGVKGGGMPTRHKTCSNLSVKTLRKGLRDALDTE